MILRVGGRRLREDLTGGSSEEEGGAMAALVRSTHGLSAGVIGVVYCESAESDRSQRLGVHTPTKTRHAATSRLALMAPEDQYNRQAFRNEIGILFVIIYNINEKHEHPRI